MVRDSLDLVHTCKCRACVEMIANQQLAEIEEDALHNSAAGIKIEASKLSTKPDSHEKPLTQRNSVKNV